MDPKNDFESKCRDELEIQEAMGHYNCLAGSGKNKNRTPQKIFAGIISFHLHVLPALTDRVTFTKYLTMQIWLVEQSTMRYMGLVTASTSREGILQCDIGNV
jgi:hypothetical protein